MRADGCAPSAFSARVFMVLSAFRHQASGGSHLGDRGVPLPVSEAVCGRFCLRRPRDPARNPVSDLQHLQRQRPVSRLFKTLSSPADVLLSCYVLPRAAWWFGVGGEPERNEGWRRDSRSRQSSETGVDACWRGCACDRKCLAAVRASVISRGGDY